VDCNEHNAFALIAVKHPKDRGASFVNGNASTIENEILKTGIAIGAKVCA
jgi:hypothetical protein